jgi:hypothetical protein
MTAMSLDFDRSPDGEPTTPADQAPVPARQAPATMGPAQPIGPSFTPAPVPADAGPATDEYAADEHTADEPAADEPPAFEPATGELAASEVTAYRSSAAPAWDGEGTRTADGSAGRTAGVRPTAGLDGPLISEADELRTSWQRIQAAFIDDPRDAVTDAAGLVEHTAQALIGALRQRQQQLRAMWDRDGMPDGVEYADSGGTAPRPASADGDTRTAADGPDTEQLRLLLQRYRALFNHLCRP